MYRFFNPNPMAAKVGDCTVRAICRVLEDTWEDTYINLALYGLLMSDMPSANNVWGAYLKSKGFQRYVVPSTCHDCYTVQEFASDHKEGCYILALSGHVVALVDGDYYDSWDSGGEVPIYYWRKER